MLERFKAFWQGVVLAPVVNLLLKLGVSPDTVTLVGTIGVSVGALAFYPRGELLWGTVVIAAFVFSDLVDGAMARKSGRSSVFGSFWDSTLDRVGDAAIFGGLALYFAGDEGDSYLYLCLSLFCLVTGNLTSYARAKAESLGLDARGGIAERSDRLVAILLGIGFTGLLDVPWLVEGVLWVLAAASAYTVVFRVLKVRRQAIALDRSPVVPE
jgi:CDP-diacylglycerol--glycerol-3-phosphate 3-phosphatidyltransferase/CDP-diacylglycerol--inositol 3-phosphatidyltransferase